MIDPIDTPEQHRAEVIVAHRLGYWGCMDQDDMDDVTTEMIEEADEYLESYVQYRIREAQGDK